MIYIVRHGQTAGNKKNVMQGRGSDHPLNENGIRQAEEARSWFEKEGIRIGKVYSSPLTRAMQTARLIAGDLEIVQDDRLLEMDYGPYEGMDLMKPAPEVMAFFSDFVNNPAPEGMEPLAEVVRRLGEFVEELRPEAEQQDILISTHAIAMKGALEYLTPESKGSYWGKYIGNCAVYAFELRDGTYTVPVGLDMKSEKEDGGTSST